MWETMVSTNVLTFGGVYFSGMERNTNGMEVAVVAYLDCIHDLVSIIFIVFIGNTLLPGSSAH